MCRAVPRADPDKIVGSLFAQVARTAIRSRNWGTCALVDDVLEIGLDDLLSLLSVEAGHSAGDAQSLPDGGRRENF